MGYNESNFIYLKATSMEKYYSELIKAEYICEYFPDIAKVIVRKVMERVLRIIAEKLNMDSNVSTWALLNNIKFNSTISLPQEICNSIETILNNGFEHSSRNNIKKKGPKHAIELLKTMHNIFCWYFKKIEPQKVVLMNELSFKAPSTIEYEQKELKKINTDILLKDNQINNLRKKIIELGSQSKSITELNKIIMAIKEEKANLENIQAFLIEKIQIQKEETDYIENNYKMYEKKLQELKKKCDDNQEFLFNKESQLVKIEIQNEELKNLYKELDEQDKSIIRMEQDLEEELKIVRQTYEHLLNLTNQYQDILETMEFSDDKELLKVLDIQKNNIKVEINFQDGIFNENIISYTRNMPEAKRKLLIFKEILNEKIKREIMHEPLYKGFLKLADKELRIVYTIITHINNTSSFINKSKELLLKSSEDRFVESVNKNLEELKNISDDEIKLILYYKLIKLSEVDLGHIYNRRQCMKALNGMVDRAYGILMSKKDFNIRIRKLDAIVVYYLEKLIADLKSKNSKLQINEELSDKIYKMIVTLKRNSENVQNLKIYYDKFNLDTMSESMLKISIRSQPFTFLSIMLDLGGIDSYKEISSIIFEVENFAAKRTSTKGQNKETLPLNFSNEYFMILLFLSSGATSLNQKQQEELLPILLLEIMSVDLTGNSEEVNLDNYNRMVELWKKKQQKYNDISTEKEETESELEELTQEKESMEVRCEELSRNYDMLSQKYNGYEDEFKKIVMNSEKRILLPSFREYYKLIIKKDEAEEQITESKNKFSGFKSILSPEIWKDQASKIINDSNIMDLEKVLIEEAKHEPHFKKEYEIFEDLKEKIEETNELINQKREKLKDKDLLIDNIKIRINELQRQLNNMKDAYPDMQEGYY